MEPALCCSVALTELLQPPEVDAVLSPVICGGADEEMGFLQDEEGLLPPLRVEHALVPQLAHALELVAQQAVTAHRCEPLWDGARDEPGKDRVQPPSAEPHKDGGRSLEMMGAPTMGRSVPATDDEERGELGGITTGKQEWSPGTHQCHGVPGLGLAHLADGAGPSLQGLGPIGSQLLHFFPSEEELQSETKPAEDESAQTCTQSQTSPLHQAGHSALCAHGFSGQAEGQGWGYLSMGPGLARPWARLTPREMRSPLSMRPQGSVHFSVSKKSRAFSREHQVRWKSAGPKGQWHQGGCPTGCPLELPTLTLFALLDTREFVRGCGPVQVPAVHHRLCDLIVDTLWTCFPYVWAPCREQS